MVAKKNGINTLNAFFGKKILKSKKIEKKPDLIIGLNVLAHTPNLKDFIFTLDNLMTDNSVAVFEIQYVLNIFNKLQFDTLYHEHYSYFCIFVYLIKDLEYKDLGDHNMLEHSKESRKLQ